MARNTKAASAKTAGGYKRADFAIVNKIGTRHMGDAGAIAATLEKVGAKQMLGTVIGMATGTKKGKSQYGEFVGLLGSFRYVPADPAGSKIQSGVLYLPGTVIGQISAAIQDGGSAEFAFEIYVVKADRRDAPIGYQYELVPLIEDENDPLDRLMGGMEIKQLAPPTA